MIFPRTTSSSSSTASVPVTTLSRSFTVEADVSLLHVSVSWASTATISGCTFNSVAMTQIGSTVTQTAAANGDTFTQINLAQFYMVNPPAGAFNITPTLSVNSDIIVGGTSFLGVDTTNPISANNTTSGNGTTSSLAITGAGFGMSVASISTDGYSATLPTPINSQVQRLNASVTGDLNLRSATLRDATNNVTASNWTLGGTFNYVMAYAVLTPAVGKNVSYAKLRPHPFSPGLAR